MKTKTEISFGEKYKRFWWIPLLLAILYGGLLGVSSWLRTSIPFLSFYAEIVLLLLTAILLHHHLSIPVYVVDANGDDEEDENEQSYSKNITERLFNELKGKPFPLGDNDCLFKLIPFDLLVVIEGKFGFSYVGDSPIKENDLVEVVDILGYYPDIHISVRPIEK